MGNGSTGTGPDGTGPGYFMVYSLRKSENTGRGEYTFYSASHYP